MKERLLKSRLSRSLKVIGIDKHGSVGYLCLPVIVIHRGLSRTGTEISVENFCKFLPPHVFYDPT